MTFEVAVGVYTKFEVEQLMLLPGTNELFLIQLMSRIGTVAAVFLAPLLPEG